MGKISNLIQERKNNRRQLEESIDKLDGFYRKYATFSGERWRRQVNFSLISFYELYTMIGVPCIVITVLALKSCYERNLRDFLISVSAIIGFVVAVRLLLARMDRRKTEKDPDGDVYVTYWSANKKHLAQVQAEIDHISPEVDKWRKIYEDRQQQEARDEFARLLNDAQEVETRFNGLFKIIKEELWGEIERMLSTNEYGLPENVTMHVKVTGLLSTFDDECLQDIIPDDYECDLFDESWEELAAYVALLRSFRAEYDRLLDTEPSPNNS